MNSEETRKMSVRGIIARIKEELTGGVKLPPIGGGFLAGLSVGVAEEIISGIALVVYCRNLEHCLYRGIDMALSVGVLLALVVGAMYLLGTGLANLKVAGGEHEN